MEIGFFLLGVCRNLTYYNWKRVGFCKEKVQEIEARFTKAYSSTYYILKVAEGPDLDLERYYFAPQVEIQRVIGFIIDKRNYS